MRKIKINPKYEYLRAFIESIPDVFEKEGREIYNKRNLIKVLTAPDGTQVNVKRFHIPHGLNKFIYSWNIRKPKGQRAFEYPMILKRKGINTPEPLALIEERSFLNILGYSYLITIQCDYGHTLYEMAAALSRKKIQLGCFWRTEAGQRGVTSPFMAFLIASAFDKPVAIRIIFFCQYSEEQWHFISTPFSKNLLFLCLDILNTGHQFFLRDLF